MVDASEVADEGAQLTCKFVTKLPKELRVPEAALTVPANLTRYGLSQIINHLLDLEMAKPFDFLINHELLRGTLQEHLSARGASAEVVTEIEYIPLQLPPSPGPRTPHDDWIGSLVGGAQGLISASYDGAVRCVRSDGGVASVFVASARPLKALAVGGLGLAAAGDEGCVGVWELGPGGAVPAAPRQLVSLRGHTDAVAALAFSPDSALLASGGWDRGLHLWRSADAAEAAASGAPAPAAAKKRRVGKAEGAEAAAPAPVLDASAAELAGHTGAVSSLSWTREGRLASGSWDHSVRIWDAETGAGVDTLTTGKARGEDVAPQRLRGHAGWVSALCWHGGREHLLASASHDGTARLWDVRASIPLHTLAGEGKLLAAAWAGQVLGVGGEGREVVTHTL
ncbi:Ribosome biogenesis protein WDR12-like protein [Auxenochlorella protothecoides]|uniref:Ribosome biogenesis protein WDR12-like protein n=1 Tax=Auxenochlorella protothecoides TaxID=3075 RepID=A0A087SC44_AUXPR|nr:Ribosome biogenesis protein WDR12-like protein [Auxenochlorella protothecoides]KFM23298.1 Ribosome biogenesis protein WDR12-like protein [Auxenochlorella protothecoides]